MNSAAGIFHSAARGRGCRMSTRIHDQRRKQEHGALPCSRVHEFYLMFIINMWSFPRLYANTTESLRFPERGG